MDPAKLQLLIEDDEFGLLKIVSKSRPKSSQERLLSAFEEIQTFVSENGREPRKDSSDISEARLAMRLEAMAGNSAQREALAVYDDLGLLREPPPPESLQDVLSDDLADLLIEDGSELFDLEHIPKTRVSPEKVASRKPADDFDDFEPLFRQCHEELRAGVRDLVPFKNPQQMGEGSFFVLNGVLVYIAQVGEKIQDATGDSNARLRCIFENGTESDLLLRSLASQLYRHGKRVTDPVPEKQRMELDAQTPHGAVYVLRSLSEDPQVRSIPNLHKIGCTSRTTAQRTEDSISEPTYLMGPVEKVAEYVVPLGIEAKVEHLLHRVFSEVRLDVVFEREGKKLKEAREWFSVPLDVVDQAIELISSEAITHYEYDPSTQQLRLRVG
ncbi:MAG TPA: GIY-YIG nuclease family protein [Actinomycetota bacterium]|nr:GIY-YIG nuclease family protein [Actinomycetota bacterium]